MYAKYVMIKLINVWNAEKIISSTMSRKDVFRTVLTSQIEVTESLTVSIINIFLTIFVLFISMYKSKGNNSVIVTIR